MNAAPTASAPAAPPGARSHAYWRQLVECQDWRAQEPCWRLTDTGVCLKPSDVLGLCTDHLEEARSW